MRQTLSKHLLCCETRLTSDHDRQARPRLLSAYDTHTSRVHDDVDAYLSSGSAADQYKRSVSNLRYAPPLSWASREALASRRSSSCSRRQRRCPFGRKVWPCPAMPNPAMAAPWATLPNHTTGCQTAILGMGRFGRHPNLGSSRLVPIPTGDQTVWSLSLLGIKRFGPCPYWGSNRLVPVPTGDQTVGSLSLPGIKPFGPCPYRGAEN